MKKEKLKGWRFEHFLESYFKNNGIGCRRRGQAGAEDLYFDDLKMTAEAKNWGRGISTIFNLKGNKDILFVKWSSKKIRNKPILAIMDLEKFVGLLNNKIMKERK